MTIVLDTNALLWLLADDQRLAKSARSQLESASQIAVSEASLWEISIKITIGKLKPIPKLLEIIRDLRFLQLNISDQALRSYETLPLIHRDPFDRMLVAQALSNGASLLTSDTFLSDYGIKVISATH